MFYLNYMFFEMGRFEKWVLLFREEFEEYILVFVVMIFFVVVNVLIFIWWYYFLYGKNIGFRVYFFVGLLLSVI